MKSLSYRACVTVLLLGCFGAGGAAAAESMRIAGSIAFAEEILAPYRDRIERESGRQLQLELSSAGAGLLALLEGKADLAMLAASPDQAIAYLKQTRPDLPFDRLRSFRIYETRVAYPVNPDNPVRSLTSADFKRVLSGQVDNWRDVGGPDLPIRLVSTAGGGGTRLTTEEVVLHGARIAAASDARVATPDDVIKTVAQDKGAVGITQVSLVKHHRLPELRIDRAVAQPFYLVSLDDPTPPMAAIIAAAKQASFDDNP
jgi:phosphate transport system substrate-binding protein